MRTYAVKFRTKNHADCTCYVHQRTAAEAIAYVREHYADRIGPMSKLVATLVVDTYENHCI